MTGIVPLLPDPWIPLTQWQLSSRTTADWASAMTLATWAEGANDALYMPVVFPADATLYAMRALGGNTTGNYDLGFYDYELRRLASTGSTAMAAAILTLTLPEIRVKAGRTYWCAMSCSSSSSSVWRIAVGSAARMTTLQIATEASALPLPATMTPVICNSTLAPVFVFGVR